ncbi:MAG: hypothetical protein MJ106_00785 [Lentisphaeria bacterium]|nr:hypothetical protein [Lentisphaeria bacterium]
MNLLEIEKELTGPDAQAALERHDGVLLALTDRLNAACDEGMPPDDFAKAEILKEAVVIARKLLRLKMREA